MIWTEKSQVAVCDTYNIILNINRRIQKNKLNLITMTIGLMMIFLFGISFFNFPTFPFIYTANVLSADESTSTQTQYPSHVQFTLPHLSSNKKRSFNKSPISIANDCFIWLARAHWLATLCVTVSSSPLSSVFSMSMPLPRAIEWILTLLACTSDYVADQQSGNWGKKRIPDE